MTAFVPGMNSCFVSIANPAEFAGVYKMRKTLKGLLLGAAALMAPTIAHADNSEASTTSSNSISFGVGETTLEMPEHGAGSFQLDFGSGIAPEVAQADVEGISYDLAYARDLSNGWRIGIGATYFDGDGSSSRSFAIPNGTPFRRGSLTGGSVISSNWGGVGAAVQQLDVDVTNFAVEASYGRSLTDIVRADVVVSYGSRETDYRNRVAETVFTELYITNTSFTEDTFGIAARLSATLPLSERFSLSAGGSAGWGLRSAEMDAFQSYQNGVQTSSSLQVDEDLDGFIGRADVGLNFAIMPSTSLQLTASYEYDDMAPVYVAPNYVTGSAATFTTDNVTGFTYGLRLSQRF